MLGACTCKCFTDLLRAWGHAAYSGRRVVAEANELTYSHMHSSHKTTLLSRKAFGSMFLIQRLPKNSLPKCMMLTVSCKRQHAWHKQ